MHCESGLEMRVEFIVAPRAGRWTVARYQRPVSDFGCRERALAAAENFARAHARRGDKAVVKLVDAGGLQETRSFAPANLLSWD